MRWSFQIATITGIQIRLHLTFVIFLLWIGVSDALASGLTVATAGVALVLLVFGCVLLHELGHAWAARFFGIRTPDITLLPIGGIARLERIPERPSEEVVVALAGPAVSALLALLFGVLCGFSLPRLDQELHQWSDFVSKLFVINTGLLAFNLLPLFPMDGGRVLRALLAFRFSYDRSTQIAAWIGQGLAVLMGCAGFWLSAPMLMFIAVFVFFGAGSEAAQVGARESARGLRVEDTMLTDFTVLPSDGQLADAADLLVHGSQPGFPLVDADNHFLAMLTRDSLLRGLNEAGPMGGLMPYARTDLPRLNLSLPISEALVLMQQAAAPVLPAVDAGGVLVGLVSTEHLVELMAITSQYRSRFFSWFTRRRA